MRRPACVALALALLSPVVGADDGGTTVSAAYSRLRVAGTDLPGVALGARRSWRGALGLGIEATGHQGRDAGLDRREIALFAGPVLQKRGGAVRPFLHALAGAVLVRRQVTVFGVAIEEGGTCGGSCTGTLGPALSAGAGFDWRLGSRFLLRAPQADYVLARVRGATTHRLRASAGLVLRFGGR